MSFTRWWQSQPSCRVLNFIGDAPRPCHRALCAARWLMSPPATAMVIRPGRSQTVEPLSRRSLFPERARMAHFLRLMLLVCLCAVLTDRARAQLTPFYTIGADGVSLNNADFTLLVDTANTLLRRPSLANGAAARWQNDQSGSHGTISVTNTFHRDSMLCHTLSYETTPMGTTSSANKTVLNWCKTSDGSWKILSL
jgi:surface antigen